jgi:hypothetical protein
MKLADLRKLAIRKQTRIRFPLANGMECVINERGVAQVPAVAGPPQFNLEDELAAAASFTLEPVAQGGAKNPPKPSGIERAALSAMAGEAPASTPHDDHEDE